MQNKLLFSAIVAAAIGFAAAPSAFAQAATPTPFSRDAMRFEKSMNVPLSEGRSLNLHIVEMHGKRMALVPVDELNALLSRAEGHSMNIGN
ncbi:hypothetical protein [Methylocapsa aurea]|uniref:hypothetical protein n=1 Tax=Methylocapsa aurea TaxID=663610 RepID=UPI000569A267|nr:hypothetical protein [Methylocapsa aurea]